MSGPAPAPSLTARGRRRRRIALTAALLGLALCLIYRRMFLGEAIAGRDAFRLFIPNASFLLDCLVAGEWPLWTPYERIGQPFAAMLQSHVYYPPHLLAVLTVGPVASITATQLMHAAFAALGVGWLCRRLGASTPAAYVGGATYGLSPLFTVLAMQQNVAASASWAGFIVLAALEVARRPTLRAAALLALPVALSFLAGSPETLVWQAVLALCAIGWTRRGVLRSASVLGLGGIWAGGLASVLLLPAVEFAANSTRSGELFQPLAWSVSFPQLFSMAWPLADHPRGDYWGPDQWFIPNLFLGAVACALAIGASRARRLRPLVLGALVLTALSLGAHLPWLKWIHQVPPLSFFRYPVKYVVGVAFSLSVLSAFGVDRFAALGARLYPSARRVALALGALFGSVALGTWALRALSFRVGLEIGFFWFALWTGGAAVAWLSLPGGPRRGGWLRWTAAALIGLELACAHLMWGFPGFTPLEDLRRPSRLAAAVQRPQAGRISVDLSSDDEPLQSSQLKNDAYIQRSRDALVPLRFIEERLMGVEGYGAPEPARLEDALRGSPRPVFDLLGASYYVRRGGPPFPDLTPVATGPELPALFRSETAMPRAFVVHRARVVSDPEALRAIRDPAQPAREIAFLAEGEPLDAGPCQGSWARLEQTGFNRLDIALEACADGYLVVTDAHYPGWMAELDGEEVPIRRADFLVRAVRVPPGRHQVVMRYRPWTAYVGAALSLLALAGWGLVLARTKRSRDRPGARPSIASHEKERSPGRHLPRLRGLR